MKGKIISAIVGWIGGIGGALIFEPISGISDILFSDYTIGGIAIGLLSTFILKVAPTLKTKILYNIGIGLAIFLVLGIISGSIVTDLIAGLTIGVFVALASHYLTDNVTNMVDKAENLIDKNK